MRSPSAAIHLSLPVVSCARASPCLFLSLSLSLARRGLTFFLSRTQISGSRACAWNVFLSLLLFIPSCSQLLVSRLYRVISQPLHLSIRSLYLAYRAFCDTSHHTVTVTLTRFLARDFPLETTRVTVAYCRWSSRRSPNRSAAGRMVCG